MARPDDHSFEICFYESIFRRDPKFTEVVEILAHLYTKTGRIQDGLQMDRKMVKLRPNDPTAHYNLACSLALLGRENEALKTLRFAASLGYHDSAWMLKDPDLESLREHPEFVLILAQIRAKQPPP